MKIYMNANIKKTHIFHKINMTSEVFEGGFLIKKQTFFSSFIYEPCMMKIYLMKKHFFLKLNMTSEVNIIKTQM